LRNCPLNELVEIVFQINFYSDFFLSLQHKRNLIPVLRALYVFTDAQLTCLEENLKESKVEDLQDRISLLNCSDNKLAEIVFQENYGEENFLYHLQHKRNLIPVLQTLFVLTDAQLTCLQQRLAEDKEKKWKNGVRRIRFSLAY
jgi:hypothetical protein